MKYFDCFSGIGGFSLGIEKATNNKWECVGNAEINKFASAIYKFHFPKVQNYGDVSRIRSSELPNFDLFTFGFPCQDLSIAGKRRGLEGSRSGLFFEAIRIINEKRPSYFIFENVKGLFSSNEGKDFELILRTIADIGYDGQWQMLNTSWFLPQNRERIYFVGYLRKKCRPKIFPIGESNGGDVTKISIIGDTNKGGQKASILGIDGISSSLTSTDYKQPKQIAVALTETRTEEAKRLRRESMKKGRDYSPRRGKEITTRKDNMMNTITANQSIEQSIIIAQALQTDGYLRHGSSFGTNNPQSSRNIRRLIPIECERLQGFFDNYTKYGIIDNKKVEISDTQRYKCLGNAISVPVVEAIISKLEE